MENDSKTGNSNDGMLGFFSSATLRDGMMDIYVVMTAVKLL
jgi:hypothetical protein